MAFLCPVRIRRNKKKKPIDDESVRGPAPSMGRITGSASIETLVRVGIEKENGLSPESKMVVIHDFTPCVDDELEVKRGQVVHILYQENDWVYVISEENKEGFIPYSYTAPFGSQMAGLALNVKKKMPSHSGDMRYSGTELVMLYDYKAQAPDDLSVRRGDWVYADLNNQTVDGWLWAYAPKTRKYGFIPKAYARPPAMTSL